jgi:hypothetical protein
MSTAKSLFIHRESSV